MIVGIGSDLIDIRRIERTLARHGDRFTQRVFTPHERSICDARRARGAAYAKRFAAKEALSKALGTGLQQSIYWRDMGVVTAPGGKPRFEVTGPAKAHLDQMTPAGCNMEIHLTVTDDYPLAQAFVILYASGR